MAVSYAAQFGEVAPQKKLTDPPSDRTLIYMSTSSRLKAHFAAGCPQLAKSFFPPILRSYTITASRHLIYAGRKRPHNRFARTTHPSQPRSEAPLPPARSEAHSTKPLATMSHQVLVFSLALTVAAVLLGSSPVLGSTHGSSWNNAALATSEDFDGEAALNALAEELGDEEGPVAVVFTSKKKREPLLGSVPRRICGSKLVKAVVEICHGCVRSPGMVKVETKRDEYVHIPRKNEQSITRMCCANPCTRELIKQNFCC
uniref:IlGF domain-containing protein n=1 Tax=Steinernema glaseri TaxID=37863 RepID=A0A1I7YH88_9BILA